MFQCYPYILKLSYFHETLIHSLYIKRFELALKRNKCVFDKKYQNELSETHLAQVISEILNIKT